jgi:hypothetical protein
LAHPWLVEKAATKEEVKHEMQRRLDELKQYNKDRIEIARKRKEIGTFSPAEPVRDDSEIATSYGEDEIKDLAAEPRKMSNFDPSPEGQHTTVFSVLSASVFFK